MKKLNYDDVKQIIYDNGYILLEKEYKNDSTKMLIEDIEGYKYFSNLQKIKNGKPRRFISSNPYTMFNISHYMKLHNIHLMVIDGQYLNERTKMTWIDDNGYKYYGSFSDAIKGMRFVSSINKYSIENIKRFIQLNNKTDTLLSTRYISNSSKLLFKCKNGHIFEMSWNGYSQNKKCIRCVKRYQNKDEFVMLIKSLYGEEYSVLGDYVNSETKIKMRHNICGTIFYSKPNHLANGHGCPCKECCYKHGEEHYRWNPNLTDEERRANMSRTSINEYNRWRVAIYKRDNYHCVIDNCECTNLNAHHLNSWDTYTNQRYDINNGITLCEKHHKDFHSIYGYGRNTKEQFLEYMKNYGNTEISNQIA